MCMKDTELDKILHTLEERITEVESRIYKLEEYHDNVPSWLHHELVSDRIFKHPNFLSKIERLRERLWNIELRLETLEIAHPEVHLARLESAQNG
jgi:predicted RNase H-like nuclease (RuvC/YqgF family)